MELIGNAILCVLFVISAVTIIKRLLKLKMRAAAVLHGFLFAVVTTLLILACDENPLDGLLSPREVENLRRLIKVALAGGYMMYFPPIFIIEALTLAELILSWFIVTETVARFIRSRQNVERRRNSKPKNASPKYVLPRVCGNILKLNCVMNC